MIGSLTNRQFMLYCLIALAVGLAGIGFILLLHIGG
jgi:hypothetical protein